MLFLASKVFLVLTVCSWTVLGCDNDAVRACLEQYGSTQDDPNKPCDTKQYEQCLNNAGFDQCPNDSENYQSAQLLSLQCASLTCIQSLGNCTTEVTMALQEFGARFQGTSGAVMVGEPLCLCENENEAGDQFANQLQTCLATSGFKDCPESIKSQLDMQVANFTGSIKAALVNPQMCAMITNMFQGNCDCAKKSNECMERNLGENFHTKRQGLSNQTLMTYPGCLNIGTEEQIDDTYTCLRKLPAECGYTEISPASFLSLQAALAASAQNNDAGVNATAVLLQATKMPIAFDVVMLKFSCAKGCENPEATALGALSCLDQQLVAITADEIKALEGQNKTDFCEKMEKVSVCTGKKMSACPQVAITVAAMIDNPKLAEELKLESSTLGGVPIDLTMFSACDIKFLDYTDFAGSFGSIDTNGSAGLNYQLQVALFVAMIASLCWML